MRWLLVKDLQILKRSPLLVALLVIYPIVLSVLIGLSLSAGPDKPKVAFVNLVPPDKNEFITNEPERLENAYRRIREATDDVPTQSVVCHVGTTEGTR